MVNVGWMNIFILFFFLTVGNLKLRIPWKNLYTQPFEAVLEDIYLLIVPSSSKSNIKVYNLLFFIDGKTFMFYNYICIKYFGWYFGDILIYKFGILLQIKLAFILNFCRR